jgi:hypothetical protein
VNIFGQASNGVGGTGGGQNSGWPGGYGSGGTDGGFGSAIFCGPCTTGYNGGLGGGYGGGSGSASGTGVAASGAAGAVRIVYPGTTRQFPATRVTAVYG